MKNNIVYCYVCIFMLIIVAMFLCIGEEKKTPQKVQIVTTQKGGSGE